MVKLNTKAPHFTTKAYHKDNFSDINLEDYKGKFVVLFFYPADFTFVCPTELVDIANHYEDLKKQDIEVMGVSTDTHFVHKAWKDASESIKKVNFPLLADPTHSIAKAYNVLREHEGVADRATFVIDPEGMVKAIEINDEPIGRNAKELVRKIQALKHARSNPGQACPANWHKGEKTLTPGIDLVGKL